MKTKNVLIGMLLILSLALGACSGAKPAATNEKVTITVWDYYGDNAVKPLLDGFMKENPNITVQYEALDWDTTLEKLNVVLTGGAPPDVVTTDITWLPKFAALGAFTDLKPLSNGKLNGAAWDKAYTPGALAAVEQEGIYLGLGLANLITIFVPDVIVLGGGLMQSLDLFWDQIGKIIRETCGLVPDEKTRLLPAALGRDAGLVGAAQVWNQRFGL